MSSEKYSSFQLIYSVQQCISKLIQESVAKVYLSQEVGDFWRCFKRHDNVIMLQFLKKKQGAVSHYNVHMTS